MHNFDCQPSFYVFGVLLLMEMFLCTILTVNHHYMCLVFHVHGVSWI